MFQKRESNETEQTHTPQAGTQRSEPTRAASSGKVATIGPTVRIEGRLEAEEDVILEGRFKGTVDLKKNTLTIGKDGSLEAEVYASTILVEGKVDGDLYASERLNIRKTARVTGNIYAPRISLEDGARFRGSIDMDADSEPFHKAFGGKSTRPPAEISAARPSGSQPSDATKAETGGAGNPTGNAGNKQSSGTSG
ncbi:MAG: bactofilin family protein [Wenzhouxiangellaceae bacterium]